MDKQDRQGLRRVDELDQRYRFNRRFAEIMGIATDSRDTANRALVLADQTIADVRRLTEDGEKLRASIKINADKIEAEVKRATESEGALSSRIQQTAERIEMIVNDSTTTNGELSSRITQTAASITAEVTRATNAENELSGRISVEAGRVSLLVDDSGKVKGSVIVEAINGQSAARISADLIEMTGQTTFLTPGDFGINGKTVIHGGRIDTKTLYTKAANIRGKLVVGDIFTATIPNGETAASVKIGGFTVTNRGLTHERIYIGMDGIGLGSAVADLESENVYHTTAITPLGKLISYQPIFHEMTVKGTTMFTGSAGQIVQFAIPIHASGLIVDGVDFGDLVERIEVLEGGSSGGGHSHSYVLDESTVTADCVHNGTGVSRCSCGAVKTVVVSAYGHDYGESYRDENQPSGWAQRCSKCGDVVESSCPCNDTYTYRDPAPTCTEQGQYWTRCNDCGDTWLSSYIDPLGHDWEYYPDSSVSSEWSRVCNICGEIELDVPHG